MKKLIASLALGMSLLASGATVLAQAPATTETPAAVTAPAETPAASTPATPAPAAGVKSADAAAWAKYVPWNSASPDVKKTASGLEYVVLASGPAGGVQPKANEQAEVFYEGRLNSGGPAFDSA
ncbi:MAG: hypothetical protein EOO54_16125, partial [Haliea sp.]